MSKKNILIEPDPILRKKSQSLEKVDDELRKLMDEMLETMYAAPGIGSVSYTHLTLPTNTVV